MATVLGTIIAVLIVHSSHLEAAISPIIVLSQNVPAVAITPLFIFWFGFGPLPKVLVSFIMAFFPTVINATMGLKITELELLDLARSLDASTWQIFVKIRFPNSLPFIFVALEMTAPLSVLTAVLAEFILGFRGLGYLVQMGTVLADVALVFSALSIMAVIGGAMFSGVVIAERLLLPWYKREE